MALVTDCGSYSLASLPNGFLCFEFAVAGVISPCLPPHGLTPGIISQNNSFFHELLLVMVLCFSSRKVTNTL